MKEKRRIQIRQDLITVVSFDL
uniref:Uncharacterized protein n=1 Tax=Arundo donax TaxID=35708 RepID=A0A0A9C828_ARUDO